MNIRFCNLCSKIGFSTNEKRDLASLAVRPRDLYYFYTNLLSSAIANWLIYDCLSSGGRGIVSRPYIFDLSMVGRCMKTNFSAYRWRKTSWGNCTPFTIVVSMYARHANSRNRSFGQNSFILRGYLYAAVERKRVWDDTKIRLRWILKNLNAW